MPTNDHYIIAIGASAGGMEEIHSFFDNTPTDSVSYVIVQHLSPDFKSRMVELLAKHSKLKVTEAEQNTPVERNQVYFIPNKKVMTISDGRLQLTDKPATGRSVLTVNTFFSSLAAERGDKAIGIVLSGTGSDGSEGIKAIKKAGGMVIAANPEHAEYNGMPLNAIETGMVDLVLDPEMMPQIIMDYVNNEGSIIRQFKEHENEEKYIAEIVELIKDNLPLDFTGYKQNTIFRRIKRRATHLNYNTLHEYLSFLKSSAEEVEALAHDFLISVTSFFRDKEAFEFVETNVIPNIIKQFVNADREIKVWVAGCATGEEAYSLAIIFKEQLDEQHENVPVKIFATDIDAAALAYAGKGIYNDSITKDISPERIERFFIKEKNRYRIKPEVRKMLIFANHDLVKNPPYCNINLISCRNLLIYMTPVLQKKIYMMLHFGLKKDSYLFLGPSENALASNTGLNLINSKWKIYKNTAARRSPLFDMFSLPLSVNPKASIKRVYNEDTESKRNNLNEIINEAVTSDLDNTLICINENKEVIKTFGNTAKFLLQKNFNHNLAELLPAPLNIAFNTASTQALQTGEKVVIKGIKIKNNDKQFSVHMQVKALAAKKNGQKLLYALFSEEQSENNLQLKEEIFDEKIYINQYTVNLENELKEVKGKLIIAHERLDASLENLQSFNEEIISANEEMQSANEELQSVNEELQTINSDYQLKNKELTELNDDLNNYFRSNVNGQIFVNNDLLLMKFSPSTVNHINVRDTDIGRPISHISTSLKFETIEDDIKKVIANGGVITKEVQATNENWYQVMTMPYMRYSDNKTDGAIITFNDITDLKKTQYDLDESNKNLKQVNADLDNFVYAASHDLLGPINNIEASLILFNFDESLSNNDVKDYLFIVNESVKRLKTVIKEMAAIGKLESNMLESELLNVNEIINEIKLSIADTIASSKAVIIADLDVSHITFSKKNFRSILYNVITNAIKYKRPERDPIVIISTETTKNYVLLSVKDNGVGIPKDKVEKIFNIYGRIQTDVEGQGIGLFLAKKIVDAAGGYISVDSEPGKGSTFNIYFKPEIIT